MAGSKSKPCHGAEDPPPVEGPLAEGAALVGAGASEGAVPAVPEVEDGHLQALDVDCLALAGPEVAGSSQAHGADHGRQYTGRCSGS